MPDKVLDHAVDSKQAGLAFFDQAMVLLEKLRHTQTDVIQKAAELCAERISCGGRKAPSRADFQPSDHSCPDRLIGPSPEDQRGDTGPHAYGCGARATMVNDRAASGKDGRIVHWAHDFYVVALWCAVEIACSGANQRSFAQL